MVAILFGPILVGIIIVAMLLAFFALTGQPG